MFLSLLLYYNIFARCQSSTPDLISGFLLKSVQLQDPSGLQESSILAHLKCCGLDGIDSSSDI